MIYGTLDVKNMPPKIAAKGRATQDMRYALKVMRQHPLYCRWTTSKPPPKFGRSIFVMPFKVIGGAK